MVSNDYVFIAHWDVPDDIARVYEISIDVENYPRWWPQVYLNFEPLAPLTKNIGDKVRLLNWRLRAEKPLLRRLSFFFKPLFRWNHRWAMTRGKEGLRQEMTRRG